MAIRGKFRISRRSECGIALISALLLLILLSALGVALLYKVTYETHLQKADSSNSVAYYGAEAAMEKMVSDLDTLYAQQASPNWCDIENLASNPPAMTDVGVTYSEYTIPGPTPCNNQVPQSNTAQITQGPNAGLYAEIVPLELRVTADHASGNQSPEEVRMIRRVNIAEIPVFQFGVYSSSDISFFAGPNFDFTGRVQTNTNLFLAEGNGTTLTFHTAIRAAGDIVRDQLPNGVGTWNNNYQGTVLVPQTAGGCDGAKPSCRALGLNPTNEGSSINGPSATYGGTGTENSSWTGISTGTYNGMILSGSTGAQPLQMAFVQAGVGPIEIVRRPAPGELLDTSVGESRLFNQAQVRVLLSDDPSELSTGGASDAQNVRLANIGTYANGVPVTSLGGTSTYFAEGNTASGTTEANWIVPTHESTLTVDSFAPNIPPAGSNKWNLLDGYLRVEYRTTTGTYVPVTQEWLQLGFARGFTPPTAASPNTIHPNAILILQELADRNHNNTIDTGTPPELIKDSGTGTYYSGAQTRNNWYPINFYDVREGEFRENAAYSTTCRVGGIVNVIEIDVNNLRKWLAGTIGTSGASVEYTSQNGYILYFSDRRGMVSNPTKGYKNGEYGYEDVVNVGTTSAPPDNQLEAGEDSDQNTQLDTWGKATLGLGFGSGNSGNPYTAVSCVNVARPNWVSGARHAVRLVDGAVGELPSRLDGQGGGFTLASENPSYVLGDYNSNNTNGFTDPPSGSPHVSAAVIADTVTLLSNSFTDYESLQCPDDTRQKTTIPACPGRPASQTHYRLAIAGGRNLSFSQPSGTGNDFGTDGGVHNFLRFLENWSNVNAYYLGSMASMYYSQYATGVFKCCNMVYQPPIRNYAFDTDFLNMNKLPPGTPKFRDVESVGYQQVF
ncbi:MAG TPA: hypothetical protein VMT53_10225 [Terriglobales bacterium]|nr:hypothetical protein [Terriglobales bacterium]